MRRGTPTAHDVAGMEYALRLARAAAVRDEVPVGCVLMHGSTVLGESHNETEQRHDPMAHAEVLALQRAIQAGFADLLPVATMYLTLEPCAQCAGAIVLARVGRVVFGAWDQRAGMAGSVYDVLRNPRLNHRPEVVTGLFEAECGEVLKQFFRAKRG